MFYLFIIFSFFFSFFVFNNSIFFKNPFPLSELNRRSDDDAELIEFEARRFLGGYVLVMVAIVFDWFSWWQRAVLIVLAAAFLFCVLNYIYEKKGLFGLFVGIVLFAAPFVAWNYQWILLFLSGIDIGATILLLVLIVAIVFFLAFFGESILNFFDAVFTSNNPAGSFGQYMEQLTLVFFGGLLLLWFIADRQ